MAIRVQESIVIDRLAETIFMFLRNVENDPMWQRAVVEASVTSGTEITGVGGTGVHKVRFLGMTDEYGWEVVEYDEPTRATWQFASGPLSGRAGFDLEPADGGTKLTMRGEVQPLGLRRILAPIMGPAWAKETRRDLQSLKRILEAQS